MKLLALLAILLLVAPAPVLAARAEMVLSKITGRVEVATAASPEWQTAVEGMTLRAEDKIRTGADGTARVSYPDAELRLTPEATVVLGYTSVRMQVGTTWVRMRKSGRTFEILTPTVAVTIRGTLVRTTTGPGGAAVHLLTGKVDVRVGGVVERLEPRMQVVAPASGAALISRIDGSTMVKLMGEYGDLSQGKATSSPVGPPPPKSGGSGSGGDAGGAPAGRAAGGDAGQKALAAGLQGIERDLDARSTGMGVSGGSESAFDGPAGTTPSGSSGAGRGVGGSLASGTQSRTLVSRPGGAGSVPMGGGMGSSGGGGVGGGVVGGGAGGGVGGGGGGVGGGGVGGGIGSGGGGGSVGGGGGGNDGNNGVGGGTGGGRENNRGRGGR